MVAAALTCASEIGPSGANASDICAAAASGTGGGVYGYLLHYANIFDGSANNARMFAVINISESRLTGV